jgi:ketosteroid isomerase-like protein
MPTRSDPDAVRAYYEYVDAGEYDALLSLFASDVTYDRPGQDSIDGRDALARFYREDRPLTDGAHDVTSLLVDGDEVAVRGRFEGRQDGDRVAFGFADFHTFDDQGLITHRVTYTDRDTV